jgi:hypothetical protein
MLVGRDSANDIFDSEAWCDQDKKKEDGFP